MKMPTSYMNTSLNNIKAKAIKKKKIGFLNPWANLLLSLFGVFIYLDLSEMPLVF